jgi:hypothetical protein
MTFQLNFKKKSNTKPPCFMTYLISTNRVVKVVFVGILDLQLHHLHINHPVLLLVGHHANELVVHVAFERVGLVRIELVHVTALTVVVVVVTVLFLVS